MRSPRNWLGVMIPALLKAALSLVFVILFLAATGAHAGRIKDIASVQGVRPNQLIGYGIVVGLENSGDQTTQTPFTTQTIANMLGQMGVNLAQDQVTRLQLRNVAAVMVTASLPAFAKPGQSIDVTVSSMGNARSLRGGTLLMTPLKGADGQVYALAQGAVLVGGVQNTSRVQVMHLSAGRIPDGAVVERSVNTRVGDGPYVFLELNDTDFETAQRIVDAINRDSRMTLAQALDGRQIQVLAPEHPAQRVAFLGRIQNLEVTPSQAIAKVVINPRTGSVVMNQNVKLDACAVAHGTLTVAVNPDVPPQPGETGSMINVKAGTNLADVVKALNALGANPLDLLAILQAMKSAGALRAELEVI